MADHGVSITWGEPKAGREKKALDLFAEVSASYDKSVANGKIESWDVVIFESTGTPPAGAIRIHGTREQVEEYVQSEEFLIPFQRASLVLNNVGMRRFFTGAALLEGMGQFAQVVDSL